MKILIFSKCCSPEVYIKNTPEKFRTDQQCQKYMRVFIEGLVSSGASVEVASNVSINRRVSKKILLCSKDDKAYGAQFHYFPAVNFKWIGRISQFINGFCYARKWLRKNKDGIIIFDPNTTSMAAGIAKTYSHRKGKHVILLTDEPMFHTSNTMLKRTLRIGLAEKLMTKCDGYIFLTEAMNKLLNTQNKPYIVIEGFADEKMSQKSSAPENKYKKRVMMYTGAVEEKYGLKTLTEAFLAADVPGTQLQIYGGGGYVPALCEIAKRSDKIKYMGIKLNDEIVECQMKASVLVNPRPTDKEYTKYSFPSKNIEYMASGTPVLTTKLPGMPLEYYDYIYTIANESVEGMENAIKEVFSYTDAELLEKGEAAKEWILKNKSNIVLGKKIISFLGQL